MQELLGQISLSLSLSLSLPPSLYVSLLLFLDRRLCDPSVPSSSCSLSNPNFVPLFLSFSSFTPSSSCVCWKSWENRAHHFPSSFHSLTHSLTLLVFQAIFL